MDDDLDSTVDTLDAAKRQSIVSQILRIQKSRARQPRSFEWANTLTCLTLSSSDVRGDQRMLEKVPVDIATGDYVSVSYKCDGPHTSDQRLDGGYTIVSKHGSKPSRVRDDVLGRTIKYMQTFDISSFWIDQECINQDDASELECALQSMDLVYRCSKNPIGVLTTPIETQEELDLLLALVSGALVTCQNAKLRHEVCIDKAQKTLHLLQRLSKDPWWMRRWIFQETYCSALHMDLLIPHKDGLSKRGWPKRCQTIHGEVLIKFVTFRNQATLFILACRRSDLPGLNEVSQLLSDVIDRIKSYRILHEFEENLEGQSHHGQPMSIQILRDLSIRRVTKPVDTLAILSNCCGYDTRLDSHKLEKHKSNSLSLAVLTLLLLNGEILWNKRRVSTAATMLELLEAQTFDHFNPPVEDGQLTFMKKTRFVNVHLCGEGIQTTGHLWNIEGSLPTKEWSLGHVSSLGQEKVTAKCLRRLVTELRNLDHKVLALNIEQYLSDNAPDHLVHAEGLQRVFDDTASMLASAIAAGEDLIVARHYDSHSQWGVFISDWDESSYPRPTAIFTAYEGAEYDEVLEMTRRPDKYVSLGVYTDGKTSKGLPLL